MWISFQGCNNAGSTGPLSVCLLQVSSGQGVVTTCPMVWLFPKHLWMNQNEQKGCQQGDHLWISTTTRLGGRSVVAHFDFISVICQTCSSYIYCPSILRPSFTTCRWSVSVMASLDPANWGLAGRSCLHSGVSALCSRSALTEPQRYTNTPPACLSNTQKVSRELKQILSKKPLQPLLKP